MNAINLFEATAAEEAVVVDATKDNTTKFTKANLNTYNDLRDKNSYPHIFGSTAELWGPDRTPWFDTTGLVDVSLVNYDDKYGAQKVRITTNPEEDKLLLDIRRNKFGLRYLGIILVRRPDGRYDLVEGRTRFGILVALGMTNIIAEIMYSTTKANIRIFGNFMNNMHEIAGSASFEDNKDAILSLTEDGDDGEPPLIGRQNNSAFGRKRIADDVNYYLDKMAATKLKPSERDMIIAATQEGILGVKTVLSFKPGEAQERLEEILGAKRIAEDAAEGIIYIANSDNVKLLHSTMIRHDLHDSTTEVRFVIYKGTLDMNDPEKCWNNTVRNFKKRFKVWEEKLSKRRFHGVEADDSVFKVYAGIPQVMSFEKDIPADRLYIYQ